MLTIGRVGVHFVVRMPPKKRSTPFNQSHCLEYGVKVCQVDPALRVVLLVACLFCIHFGREVKVGQKRKATCNTKYFKRPFRKDNYNLHMEGQHSGCWSVYHSLSKEDKAKFFDENAPVVHQNTIKSHFSGTQAPVHWFVNKNIFDVIIGEMLFHPDDLNEKVTKERALAIFEDVLQPVENADDSDLQQDPYHVIVKNQAQFNLVVDYVRVGASFQMVSQIVQMTKDRMGLASIGCSSEGKVTSYIRIACALNLQKLSELLASSWTFSLAMDMSTHLSTSYLDIRICVFKQGEIYNFHLLAIPMFRCHTGNEIF